jgi:ubiquinol oxidase
MKNAFTKLAKGSRHSRLQQFQFRSYNNETPSKPGFNTFSTVAEHYHKNHTPVLMFGEEKVEAPYTDTSLLEKLPGTFKHQEAKTIGDKLAYGLMLVLRQVVHLVFRDKYSHHAVVLETVAAVPGMISGMIRHFTSLRRMTRDFGMISKLIEDAENERMHLLTWMQLTSPTFFERIIVITAQLLFTPFYTFLYILSPTTAHRLVGYLEEEAVLQYTAFLTAIDAGKIKNVPAPEIAITYWNLPPKSTLRDVVLVVRADECYHRDINHDFGDHFQGTIH